MSIMIVISFLMMIRIQNLNLKFKNLKCFKTHYDHCYA